MYMCLIASLNEGTTYYIRVRHTGKKYGSSDWSSVYRVSTLVPLTFLNASTLQFLSFPFLSNDHMIISSYTIGHIRMHVDPRTSTCAIYADGVKYSSGWICYINLILSGEASKVIWRITPISYPSYWGYRNGEYLGYVYSAYPGLSFSTISWITGQRFNFYLDAMVDGDLRKRYLCTFGN